MAKLTKSKRLRRGHGNKILQNNVVRGGRGTKRHKVKKR